MELELPFKNIKEVYRQDFTIFEDVKYTFLKEEEGELDYHEFDNYYERHNKLYITDPNGIVFVGETMETGDKDDLILEKLDSTFRILNKS